MTLSLGRLSGVTALALLAALGACTGPNPRYRPLAGDGSAPRDGASAGDAAAADTPDAVAAASLTRGLVAYWTLDEGRGTTTADRTGNGNDGTLVNGPTWVTGGFSAARFPNPGSVFLDGVDDYVDFMPRLLPRSSTPKALSMWVWLESTPEIRRQNILVLVNDMEGATVQVGLDQGRFAAWHVQPPIPRVVDPRTASAGWHHVALTFDGTIERLWVDGLLVSSTTGNPADTTHPVLRAQAGSVDGANRVETFRGRVDDVRIYDRALDEREITMLGSGQ